MKKTILVILMIWKVSGGSITCGVPPYTMILNGSKTVMGIRQQEHMVLEKVHKHGGVDGKWKVTKWTYTIRPSHPSIPDFRGGWVRNGSQVYGFSEIDMLASGGTTTARTIYYDVYHGKIGSRRTRQWLGTIRGDNVTFQLVQPQKLRRQGYRLPPGTMASTMLRGKVYLAGGRREGSLRIQFQDHVNGDVIFDSSSVGRAHLRARVINSRGDASGGYIWGVDTIEGVDVDIVPLGSGEVDIRFRHLPEHNDRFGKHTVKVSYRSADNRCRGEASKTFRLFYRGTAFNHPSHSPEEKKMPNWFYYWRQTPAARPREDRSVTLKYGGKKLHIIPTSHPNEKTPCDCANPGYTACYPGGLQKKVLYICDHFDRGMPTKYPILNRRDPRRLLGWRETGYIDTFAVSIIHEYQHYLDDMRWNFWYLQYAHPEFDKDRDGIADADEPALKFSPGSYQTYCPFPFFHDLHGHCQGLDLGGDEEWLAYEAMRFYRPGTYDRYDWSCPGKQIDRSHCP